MSTRPSTAEHGRVAHLEAQAVSVDSDDHRVERLTDMTGQDDLFDQVPGAGVGLRLPAPCRCHELGQHSKRGADVVGDFGSGAAGQNDLVGEPVDEASQRCRDVGVGGGQRGVLGVGALRWGDARPAVERRVARPAEQPGRLGRERSLVGERRIQRPDHIRVAVLRLPADTECGGIGP